jgi:hypothetical protein
LPEGGGNVSQIQSNLKSSLGSWFRKNSHLNSQEEKMIRTIFLIATIYLFGIAVQASATSPVPEEVMPVEKENVCTTHVVYISEHEGAVVNEQTSSVLAFGRDVSKKEVLDKTASYLSNKLNEVNMSEFKVECKFVKIK